jgi:glycosyltransferase involved in cell wall biosynthesis
VKTVCHVTTVHERFDVRIYYKQCRTLASAGLDVSLLVADGLGDETREGVRIRDAGPRPTSRLKRMTTGVVRMRSLAIEMDADLYHLHDPELLPLGLFLKRRGKKVIFDSHEDYVADMLVKPYLKLGSARLISFAFRGFQAFAARRIDLVIAATPNIADIYTRLGARVEIINNYPLAEEIASEATASRQDAVIYAGAITSIRGFPRIIDAIGMCESDATLFLAGPFTDKTAEQKCHASPGWARTRALGVLPRARMHQEMSRCLAGLVVLEPVPTFVVSRPNKLFEYMANGLAVIASDFPAWREIVEGTGCGICVDPADAAAIARAIDSMIADPQWTMQMGRNGRRAVTEIFNWTTEGDRLLTAYRSLGVA